MINYAQDLAQEETFATALTEILTETESLRAAFFVHHASGDSPVNGNHITVKRKDNTHLLEGHKVELDLFLADHEAKRLVVIELKGRGGSELPRQTVNIATVIQRDFPDWEHTLLYAIIDGEACESLDFKTISLNALLKPLREYAESSTAQLNQLRGFLESFDQDVNDLKARAIRNKSQAQIKDLAQQLLKHAIEIASRVSELAGLSAELERSYHHNVASVWLHRPNWAWEGFHFVYAVTLQPDGTLVATARIGKHGRKNITSLKALHQFIELHPIKPWLDNDRVKIHDDFSGENLSLLSYEVPPFSEEHLKKDLIIAVDEVLVPAIKTIDTFVAQNVL